MIEPDDPKLNFISIDEAQTLKNGLCRNYIDYWWIIHPEKGIMRYDKASFQCHSNKNTTEYLAGKLYPWAEIRQFPFVCVQANPSDYY